MSKPTPPASRAAGAIVVCLLLALSGCGGGGGAETSSTATASASTGGTSGTTSAGGTPTETTPTGGTAPTPAPVACNATDISATALAAINRIRAAGADCRTFGNFPPAPALAWSALLNQAAAGHSLDMATMNFFAHVGTGGSTLDSRVNATGYAWQRLGENIVAGPTTLDVDTALTIWLSSDAHCANIMNPNFDAVAMACAPGGASATYKNYWTMDLARAL